MCMCTCEHNYITYFYGALPQTEKNEWNKCKNHFNEMKGDVGNTGTYTKITHPYIFVLELTAYNYFLFLCS